MRDNRCTALRDAETRRARLLIYFMLAEKGLESPFPFVKLLGPPDELVRMIPSMHNYIQLTRHEFKLGR